jgi:hypothetical protein
MNADMSIEEMKSRGINPVARQLQSVVSVWKDGNYSKFYALLRKLPGDKEDIKRQLVLQYTSYRTDSLKEITYGEYKSICNRLQEMVTNTGLCNGNIYELRRHRSICLLLMQKLGIDTTDWTRINAFCQDGRIAGKVFRDLNIEDLEILAKKLRSIERKGGIRTFKEPGPTAAVVPIR